MRARHPMLGNARAKDLINSGGAERFWPHRGAGLRSLHVSGRVVATGPRPLNSWTRSTLFDGGRWTPRFRASFRTVAIPFSAAATGAGQEVDLQPDRSGRGPAWLLQRYLQRLSALDDHSAGVRGLDRLREDRRDEGSPHQGPELPHAQRTGVAPRSASSAVQHPGHASGRLDCLGSRFEPGCSLPTTQSHPPAWPNQAGRRRLSLLPDLPRPRRHRRRPLRCRNVCPLLPARDDSCLRTMPQSSPF